MRKKIDFNEEFSKRAKEAAGICFWESEYWKRKFLSDNEKEISNIKSEITVLNDYVCEFLSQCHLKNDYLYPLSLIKIMQREFYRRSVNSRICYKCGEEKMSNFFSLLEKKEFSDIINRILYRLNYLSFNYHYYADDLVAPMDMDELASLVLADSQLPPAPCLYHHKDAVYEVSEDVYRIFFPEQADEKVRLPTLMGGVEGDYIVLINFKNRKFNYSKVVNTFRKQLAFLIYREKGFAKMTDEEKKDIIYTFKSDAGKAGKGYGSEFVVSRAVGLWIWDNRFNNKHKAKIDIFREIESTKYKNNFDVKGIKSSSSVYIKLKRILDCTVRCIESGKVLSMSGK